MNFSVRHLVCLKVSDIGVYVLFSDFHKRFDNKGRTIGDAINTKNETRCYEQAINK